MHDTYADGHHFEQVAMRRLIHLFNPEHVYTNLLFNKYPIYELDILMQASGVLLCLECKAYSHTLASSDGSYSYQNRSITNTSKLLRSKVKTLNSIYNVNAYGFILVADNTGIDSIPNAIKLSELSLLRPILSSLQTSDSSFIKELTNENYQLEQKRKRGYKL